MYTLDIIKMVEYYIKQLRIDINNAKMLDTMILLLLLLPCVVIMSRLMEIDDESCVDVDDPSYCSTWCHQWSEYFIETPLNSTDTWFTHTYEDLDFEGQPSDLCEELSSFTNIVDWVLDDQFFYYLIDFTNAHAVAHNDVNFVPITRDAGGIIELKAWFTIYWESAQLKLSIEKVFNQRNGQQRLNQLMTRDRFWDIHRNIKFAHEDELDLTNPRRHFDTLVDYIKRKVNRLWIPGDLFTIDEGRIKGKSKRNPYLTFEPNKPDRSGQNNYKCCQKGENTVGFTVANVLYVGSQTYTNDDEGKITNIVHQLIDSCGFIAGQVYILDSLFTSIELLDLASERDVGIVGTFKFPLKDAPMYFKEQEFLDDMLL